MQVEEALWLMLEGKAGAQFSLGSHARSIAVGFVLTLVAPRQDLGEGELHGHLEMGSRRVGRERKRFGEVEKKEASGLMLQVNETQRKGKSRAS